MHIFLGAGLVGQAEVGRLEEHQVWDGSFGSFLL